MTLTIRQTNVPTADGIYTVRARGCIASALYWASEGGRLDGWIPSPPLYSPVWTAKASEKKQSPEDETSGEMLKIGCFFYFS